MNYYEILLPLALILLLSKFMSILFKKLGLPQVVGMLLAGILLGLIKFIPGQTIFNATAMEGISFLAKIGVIFIMFSAGIETDLKQFKSTGVASVVITTLGVAFPLLFGFLVASAFNGGFHVSRSQILSNLFYGTILAATSVSITVAALKELGKLQTRVGTSIVSAAILDDIIGIVLLSLMISLDKSGSAADVWVVVAKLIAFFAMAIPMGYVALFIIRRIDLRYPHTRRIPILCVVVCFVFAYAAEKLFGIADITGAYVAGLMLSGIADRTYVDRRIEISNYMIFAPAFFANIGINLNFDHFNPAFVGFGFAFVAAGILGKVVGCGLGGLICGYGIKDSYRVGIGMMVRAEVVLVCTQKGIDYDMVNPSIMPFVLILILVTSLITPLLLRLSYKKEENGGKLPPINPNEKVKLYSTDDNEFDFIKTDTDKTI